MIKEYSKSEDGEICLNLYKPIQTQEECIVYSKQKNDISKLEKKLEEMGVNSFKLFFVDSKDEERNK